MQTLTGFRRLSDHTPRRGERWIYSAGFNVRPSSANTDRIDVEVPDIRSLASAGARVAVLSHQGSHRDGTAVHLDMAAAHLTHELGCHVDYFPGNTGEAALRRAAKMTDGDVVIFGNTRLHPGEETDDPLLARQFAALGDNVAVGGFSKAHRSHASNCGVLRYRPGYATSALLSEAELLQPWAGPAASGLSLAVLGGQKAEKTTVGLRALSHTYSVVIPGGVALNTILAVQGYQCGSSALGTDPRRCAEAVREVFARSPRAQIHVPAVVVTAPVGRDEPALRRLVPIAESVPHGERIVDFVLEPWAKRWLAELSATGGRAIVAGPPGIRLAGSTGAAAEILKALASPRVDAMLVGGDTVAELPWAGPTSTGGGSALTYLATGDCAVFSALRRNATEVADQ